MGWGARSAVAWWRNDEAAELLETLQQWTTSKFPMNLSKMTHWFGDSAGCQYTIWNLLEADADEVQVALALLQASLFEGRRNQPQEWPEYHAVNELRERVRRVGSYHWDSRCSRAHPGYFPWESPLDWRHFLTQIANSHIRLFQEYIPVHISFEDQAP